MWTLIVVIFVNAGSQANSQLSVPGFDSWKMCYDASVLNGKAIFEKYPWATIVQSCVKTSEKK